MTTIDYSAPLPPIANKDIQRYHRYISKEESGCWQWIGKINSRWRYGKFYVAHKEVSAHRLAYFLGTGVDPHGYCVCHTCDNRSCVNPEHLFLGTNLENAEDRERKGRGITGQKRVYKTGFGETHPAAKLTEEKVKEIRHLYAMNTRQVDIAARFGIAEKLVWKIVHRHRWKHI